MELSESPCFLEVWAYARKSKVVDGLEDGFLL